MTTEAKKEPTTAELFATARKAVRADAGTGERGRGLQALAALKRRMGALEAFTAAVRGLEWQRMDWLGLCVFRRAAGCHGTDGHNSGAGTPTPKPHGEGCPFHLLAADTSKGAR